MKIYPALPHEPSSERTSVQDVADDLARDPLRNIVLLKQLLAYRKQVRVRQVSGPEGMATLVELDTAFSLWDRQVYPKADITAFVSSDHPKLIVPLIAHLPRGAGIVFKLCQEADVVPVQTQFSIERRTAFMSFTAAGSFVPDSDVRTTSVPSEAAYQLFESQGHDRGWLEPLLVAGKAFACVLEHDGLPLSACLAFENYSQIWEVGGVVTIASRRKRGLGARVVRTALARLSEDGLVPRYQVEEHNEASIGLARSVSLTPFLTITHYAHEC